MLSFILQQSKIRYLKCILFQIIIPRLCIADLAANVSRQGNVVTDETVLWELSDDIARKLFVIEQATQARMAHLTDLQ